MKEEVAIGEEVRAAVRAASGRGASIASIASGAYCIVVGDNSTATHNHAILIGNNLRSVADMHIHIKVGDFDLINEIASPEMYMSLRELLAKAFDPALDISTQNEMAEKDLLDKD